jgi:hypothetical protein
MDYKGPASDQLCHFAQTLGLDFEPEEITARELILLIVKARTDEPPTYYQARFAMNLDIDFDPITITKREISRLLSVEVAAQSRKVLETNPALASGKTVMVGNRVFDIVAINRRSWKVTMVPFGGGDSVTKLILSVADAQAVSIKVLKPGS